jgi:hypothetical protein
MSRNSQFSTEVSEILQALSALPGLGMVRITARSFPQLTSLNEFGTTYQEVTQSFPLDALPQQVELPVRVEDILIRLDGTLSEIEEDSRTKLYDMLGELIRERQIGMHWDMRVSFGDTEKMPADADDKADRLDRHEYQVSINGPVFSSFWSG